ncbi:DUF1120 domain-containing protein [Pseudomonas vranovensis]|uniref:DUF1120 domain-containing protein n=1 Tax=Pseudomonas vranovensis TaxID=321661 RepID=UPI0006880B54|nr:DUF1120 domain-containing protein [Pseudomonas vranovensis]
MGLVTAPEEVPSQIESRLLWGADKGIVPVQSGQVAQGRTLQVQLEVTTWTQEEALRVRDETVWEDTGVFELTRSGISRELNLRTAALPASCVPTLTGGGEVNFGTRTAQQLSQTSDTPLSPRTVELNIHCDAPARFALHTVDSRNGSASGSSDSDSGLGMDSAGNRIGRFSVSVDAVQADAFGSAFMTQSTTAGSTWSAARVSATLISKNAWLGFSDRDGSTDGLEALEQLRATLTVLPIVVLELNEAVELDGSATIEIRYI